MGAGIAASPRAGAERADVDRAGDFAFAFAFGRTAAGDRTDFARGLGFAVFRGEAERDFGGMIKSVGSGARV